MSMKLTRNPPFLRASILGASVASKDYISKISVVSANFGYTMNIWSVTTPNKTLLLGDSISYDSK